MRTLKINLNKTNMTCTHYRTESCPIRNCKIYAKPEHCYLALKTAELAKQGMHSSPSELIGIILDSLNKPSQDVVLAAEGLN